MSFEVEHNSNRLQCRRTYELRSVRRAAEAVKKLMEAKQPRGLRCRYGFDVAGRWVHLETRTSMAMETVVRHLRDGGFIVRRMPTKEMNCGV